MSLTRRVYGGKKSRISKKGRGHWRFGGKKTLKKGGKRVFSLGGKSLKNGKKSKRRTKRGGGDLDGYYLYQEGIGLDKLQFTPNLEEKDSDYSERESGW